MAKFVAGQVSEPVVRGFRVRVLLSSGVVIPLPGVFSSVGEALTAGEVWCRERADVVRLWCRETGQRLPLPGEQCRNW